MKTLLSLLLAIIPLNLLASTADLNISLAGTPQSAETGSVLPITVHLTNPGPDAAEAPSVALSFGSGFFTSVDNPGWECNGRFASIATCRIGGLMPPGSEVVLHFGAQMPNNPSRPLLMSWEASLSTDPITHADMNVDVVSSSTIADVKVSSWTEPSPVLRGQQFEFVSRVENRGASPVGAVTLFVDNSSRILPVDFSTAGPQWTCIPSNIPLSSGSVVACVSSGLAAGESRELRYVARAPDDFALLTRTVRLFFAGAADRDIGDNVNVQTVTVGVIEDFERFLLPVSIDTVPGAFGSQWTSELHVMNSSDHAVHFGPTAYFCQVSSCPPVPPFGNVLNPGVDYEERTGWRGTANVGVFVYSERADSSHLHFNLRIKDLSRQSQTWGTEIPVIRERDLKTVATQLLNVPVGDGFRQTIRIYDFDAHEDAKVAVRLYGHPYGTKLLAETVLDLAVPTDNSYTLSPMRFTLQPGYAQLDALVDRFPALQGQTVVRLEIEPLTPGLRYWAFASITNNETQHVTTITPQ